MTDTRRPASATINTLPRHTMHSYSAYTGARDEMPVTSQYMDTLVAKLQLIIDNLHNPASLRGGGLVLSAPLQHSASLQVGDVYVDGEGHLRIRQSGAPLVDGLGISGSIASVTVSIT